MRAIRKIAVVALMVLSTFLTVTGIAGQTAHPLWTYDYSSFAVNLVPGTTVEVGFAAEVNPVNLPAEVRWEGRFGSLLLELDMTVDRPNPVLSVTDLAAEALMEQCINGFISVQDEVYQIDLITGAETIIGSRDGLAPCNWIGSTVTAVAPVQTFVCGANNDRITLQRQSPGVTLARDSGWSSNQRTIRYSAGPGYTLDGPAEFAFTDQPNRLCPVPWPTSPPVVVTPRATLPPLVIRPTPRGFPAPVITIVPTPMLPDQWTPSPYPPGFTPTPQVFVPIPIQPTPRGFPMPRVTIVPPKPTPVTDTDVSEGTSTAQGPGKSVVMALTPAAVILGTIAVINRRHDD